MRNIFNKLDGTTTSTTTTTTTTTTTPTPCEKAKTAYKNHCAEALNDARKTVCKKKTEWLSAKGNSGKTQKQYEAAIKVLKDLEVIIAGPVGKARREAILAKAKLPNVAILTGSIAADAAKAAALKTLGSLLSAVTKIKGCSIAPDYVCKGNSTSCKKLVNNNEEKKNERKNKMKNKRKSKKKNKPKNERKNKMKNKPKNERKNKMKNKPKNERKNKMKNKPKNKKKAEKKAERKDLRKAERKAERKALRKNERKNESQSEE